MTVAELGERMDAEEFVHWRMLEEEDPLPDPHLSAAIVAWTTARALGGSRTARLDDFLPRRRPQQDVHEMRANYRAFLAGLRPPSVKITSERGPDRVPT